MMNKTEAIGASMLGCPAHLVDVDAGRVREAEEGVVRIHHLVPVCEGLGTDQ